MPLYILGDQEGDAHDLRGQETVPQVRILLVNGTAFLLR
jgi:hypothetical protein